MRLNPKILFPCGICALMMFLFISCGTTLQARPDKETVTALKSVKWIRYVIEEDIRHGEKRPSLHFEKNLKIIFDFFPELVLLPSDASTYDATLTITAQGKGLKADYRTYMQSSPGRLQGVGRSFTAFTGGILKGSVTLKSPRGVIQKKFKKTKEPPHEIDLNPWSELSQEINLKIYEILGEIQGAEPLAVGYASMKHWQQRPLFKSALIYLGSDAVEALLKVMDDPDIEPIYRNDVMELLGEINDPRAFDPLMEKIINERSVAAAVGIAKLKDIRAVQPMIDLIKQIPPPKSYDLIRVGRALAELLDLRLAGPYVRNAGFDIKEPKKWQLWWDKNKSRY